MYLLYVMTLLLAREMDGRVFCQDSNSLPWTPLGPACPVTCENVISAIDRLRILEYNQMVLERMKSEKKRLKAHRLIKLQASDRSAHVPNVIQRPRAAEDASVNPDDRSCFKVVEVNTTLMPATESYDKLPYDLMYDYIPPADEDMGRPTGTPASRVTPTKKYFAWQRNTDCARAPLDECNLNDVDGSPSVLLEKLVRERCPRRRGAKFDDGFVKTFTDVLNKYASQQIHFTQDMAAMLLERLLGHTDLSRGVLDIDKVLTYLRSAIKHHKVAPPSRGTVVVRGLCSGLRVAGCACRAGFVERSQQCVALRHCVTETRYPYLARVTIIQ